MLKGVFINCFSFVCVILTSRFLDDGVMGSSGVTFSTSIYLSLSLSQVGQREMRVCLNQKPNSGRDFGFKAHWDSTGACVKSVQPGKTYIKGKLFN